MIRRGLGFVKPGEPSMRPDLPRALWQAYRLLRVKHADDTTVSTVSGSTVRASPWSARILPPLALFLVTFAVFAPVLSAEFVAWDDDNNVVLNRAYRGLGLDNLAWMFSTFHMGHYQPLSWLTLGVDYELWGMHARGYHATNVFLHALTAVAFYFVARRLFALWRGSSGFDVTFASFSAASVFALHPLRVESVAWVTERRDVLSGLFFVLAMGAWLQYAIDRRRAAHATALALVLLSLGAKAAAIVTPALLVLLDVWPLKRTHLGWKRLTFEKLPFVAASVLFGWLAIRAQASQGVTLVAVEDHGIVPRLAQASFGLAYYPWRTLVPLNLIAIHELPIPLAVGSLRFVIPFVLVMLTTIALFVARRRVPALLVAWVAFAILLSPVSGLTQAGPQLVADRYSYFSCMPFALVFGGGVLVAARTRPTWHIGLTASACALFVGLSVLTFRQARVWHDSETLWRHTVEIAPSSPNGLLNLGVALMRKGTTQTDPARQNALYDEADRYFLRGLSVKPMPEMHVNLGLVALFRSQSDPSHAAALTAEALEHIQRGIALGEERNFVKYEWRLALGSALVSAGRCDEAVRILESVLPAMPETEAELRSLSLAYAGVGRNADALEMLERALVLQPDDATLWLRAGDLNRGLGRIDEARVSYENVIALRTVALGAAATNDTDRKHAERALEELR